MKGKIPSHIVNELQLVGSSGPESDIAIGPNEIQAGPACAIGRMRAMPWVMQQGEVIGHHMRRFLWPNNETSSHQSVAHVLQPLAYAC